MDDRFYPNQCVVCKATNKLKRCSNCRMISYCGEDHQKHHWKYHKSICKIISTLMKEKRVSHLFEHLRGSDATTFDKESKQIAQEVERKLLRFFRPEEEGMLKFPRVCFVCHETSQEKLKNCPSCPAASFCNQHPRSLNHDRVCITINSRFDILIRKEQWDPRTIKSAIESIGTGTRLPESKKPPSSMREFLDQYIKLKISISENMKVFLSQIFSFSLTLFNVLQILDDSPASEVIFHVDVGGGSTSFSILIGNYWESLLHLLPDIKILKIVHIEGQINHTAQVSLCKECRFKKRRLFVEANSIPYERYMGQRDYQTPNVIAYLNVEPPEKLDHRRQGLEAMLVRWSKVTCPMILATSTRRGLDLIRELLTSSSTNFRIIYDGYNDFTPLFYIEKLEDGTLRRLSQYLIIFKHETQHTSNKSFGGSESLSKTKVNRPRSFFYATVCHVCRSANPKVTCKRCRMIFYCGNKHQEEHQIHHKDICKVILSLLSEMEAPNLFDKLKTADPELWLRARIDLMAKAQLKLGRKLEEYEEQMFLFPKTCLVCHEGDLSVLRNCECGVNLCKIHKDDPKHIKLCKDLRLAFELTTSGQPPALKGIFRAPINMVAELPSSMQAFMDSHWILTNETPKQTVNFQNMATSNFLTGPLTLLYAIEKLKMKINSSMVVHIIGSRSPDLVAEPSWKFVLYWLSQLNTLKIVFIGPDISNCLETDVDTSEFSASIQFKSLKVETHGLRYDQYVSSKSFIKPNIILGPNLDIHENELGISKCTWEETIVTLKKVGSPFILTAGTEERAQKDHQELCKLLGKSVEFIFCAVNPFAALSPERDFETEGVRYSNKSIVIYDFKSKPSTHSTEGEEQKMVEESSDVEKSELAKKLSKGRLVNPE